MTTSSIHPDTTLGYVQLIVSNLERTLAFYQQSLGFQIHRRTGDTAWLGAGAADLLVLTENPAARPAPGTTGLFHFAILAPSRLDLAYSLRHLAETRTPVDGFADHLVSEAIYLSDPEGNGIEIYRDRPRAEWRYGPDGSIRMATDPLDIHGLLAEVGDQAKPWGGLAPKTILGHMHLRVASIPQAEGFYREIIGFDLMTRYGPAASFLAAGGYHHHLGINTWGSFGAPPPPPEASGLQWFVIQLPTTAELNRIAGRARQAQVPLEEREDGLFLRDPSQNGLVLTVNSR